MNEYQMLVEEAQSLTWDERYRRNIDRFELCGMYSWAIPDDEALNVLVSLAPLVEIGAGGGYWAHLLRTERVVDILAYDAKPGENRWVSRLWTKVRKGGPKKAAKFPNRTLFLCWPPYRNPMAHECLKHYRGDTVVYIGEDYYGMTGDKAFHDLLDKEWEEAHCQSLLTWDGINDDLTVYRRKA